MSHEDSRLMRAHLVLHDPGRCAEAPAKLNLTLRVFGREASGYHAISSVISPLDLADTVRIEVRRDAGAGITCRTRLAEPISEHAAACASRDPSVSTVLSDLQSER